MDLISLLASLPPPYVQPNKLDIFQTCSSVLSLESSTATLHSSPPQYSPCQALHCSPSFRQLSTFSVPTFTFTKCQIQFLSSFTVCLLKSLQLWQTKSRCLHMSFMCILYSTDELNINNKL